MRFQLRVRRNHILFALGLTFLFAAPQALAYNEYEQYAPFEVDGYHFGFEWGSYGSDKGQFWWPHGVATDTERGYVYVADRDNNRVQQFAKNGTFLRMVGFGVKTGANKFEVCTLRADTCKWGLPGSGAGQLHDPYGVAVDQASGNFYVADTNNHRIQVYGPSGSYRFQWGEFGRNKNEFNVPSGVEIARNGGSSVYVVDKYNQRIQKYSLGGGFLRMWGKGVRTNSDEFEICTNSDPVCYLGREGSGDGELRYPSDVAANSTNLYVTDTQNNQVQEFTKIGDFVSRWGRYGSGDGQFNQPSGIALSRKGVHVVDRNNRVQKFSLNGIFITKAGKYGEDPLEFNYPQGIDAWPKGRASSEVYVGDTSNSRVQNIDNISFEMR